MDLVVEVVENITLLLEVEQLIKVLQVVQAVTPDLILVVVEVELVQLVTLEIVVVLEMVVLVYLLQ